jgi:putative addiction module component (TIGR02574 family)
MDIPAALAAEGPFPELTDGEKQLLDRRLAELDASPDNVLTWEEIKARVRKGRSRV